ncbi:CPBP family intramembrane glutamic endopeptidase [Flavobacterium sp.]|uniref:CPBP family intramembrane glutamic endopeptidase n=1 Tax=Flavobacterium sp. TaxID=239 RepID=UPI002632E6C7|nr:CPBP family intramembrane glutamic endopeptidase [Flavobacterium sp.]
MILKSLIKVLPFVFALIAIFFAIKKGKIKPNEIDLVKPQSYTKIFLWIGLFFAYSLTTEILLLKYNVYSIKPWDYDITTSIIRVVGAVLLAPIVEEIIFRGVFLNLLSQKWNRTLGVLLQALFFVLLHSFAYENTTESNIGIAVSFTDAILFAIARYHTKSLYTNIGMHMSGNFIAMFERILF